MISIASGPPALSTHHGSEHREWEHKPMRCSLGNSAHPLWGVAFASHNTRKTHQQQQPSHPHTVCRVKHVDDEISPPVSRWVGCAQLFPGLTLCPCLLQAMRVWQARCDARKGQTGQHKCPQDWRHLDDGRRRRSLQGSSAADSTTERDKGLRENEGPV